MAIDFTIPEEAKEVRERVRKWVQEECIPAEQEMSNGRAFKDVLPELRKKARAQGLWLPFIPVGRWPMRWSKWNLARAISVRCR